MVRTGSGLRQFDRIQIRPKGSDPTGSGSATLLVSSVRILGQSQLTFLYYYIFLLCVGGNEDEIRSLVSSGRILGQSQLTFLTRANRADIAIHFIHVRNSTIHWLLFFLFFRIRINFPDLIPTLSFDRKTFPVPESLRNSYTVQCTLVKEALFLV